MGTTDVTAVINLLLTIIGLVLLSRILTTLRSIASHKREHDDVSR